MASSQPTVTLEYAFGFVPAANRFMGVLTLEAAGLAKPQSYDTALLLDCSWSMSDSIDSVRADATQFVESLSATDFVSIVIFSGHGTARLIAGPVQCNAAGRKVLSRAIEREVYARGTTVFSEPLQLVLEELRRQARPGTANQAVLFTDGCPVPTHWSLEEETGRALGAASALRHFGASVSEIGYGSHYDEEFCRRVVESGGHSGIFRHMSYVEDFAEVIRDIHDVFRRTQLVDEMIEISSSSNALVRGVYRAFPEVFRQEQPGPDGMALSYGLVLHTRTIYDQGVRFYLDLDSPVEQLVVTSDSDLFQRVQMLNAVPFSPELTDDCARVLAAAATLSGDTARAMEILGAMGAADVADSLAEAYTPAEQRTARDTARQALRGRTFIGKGLKPAGPSHCVLNMLRALLEDPVARWYKTPDAYQRGGVARRDPRIVRSPLGGTLRIVNYASNKERFNFSVVTEEEVMLLPVDEKGQILTNGTADATTIHRTYNIIRDGELVMPHLLLSLSQTTFDLFQEAGAIAATESYRPGHAYKVNFAGMKMVSSAWANPTQLQLVELLREEKELEAEQTALGRIAAKPSGGPGHYIPKLEAVDPDTLEYYSALCVELRLKNYKVKFSPASVEDLSPEQAYERLQAVRRRLRVVRFLYRSVVYACNLTGWRRVEWGPANVTRRGTFPKAERKATYRGAELMLVTWDSEVAY